MSIDFINNYPLSNNNYVENNTYIEFFTVPFDNSYNNIIDFKNLDQQTKAFDKIVKKRIQNVNYLIKDKIIRIKGNYKEFLSYNYLRFKNTTFENKFFYCFITKIEYKAKDITDIYIETDVWQTWQFNITYYDSYILRSHIKKSQDIVGYNVESEPINYSPEFEKQINIFNDIDWGLRWCLQALSSPPALNGSNEFEYGGVGESASDFCGYYISPKPTTNTGTAIRGDVKLYYPEDKANDHRQDIVCIKALPNWVVENTPLDSNKAWLLNRVATVSDSATINNNTLPCGYTPRNKKMLSSAFRVLVIYNFNGLQIPLKPELLNNSNITLTLSMKGATSSSIRLTVGGYNAYTKIHYQIPYQATMGVAYNENTGLQQNMDKFNATMGLIGSIAGGVGQVATGNIFGGVSNLISGVANTGYNIKSAYEQKTASIGNATDVSCVLPTNIQIRLVDCSPTYNECVHIDKFFDVYGYQVNTINKISNVMKSRNNYNYIQVKQSNIKLNGIQSDLQQLKSIFENGVTVWHNFENFGNYDVDNI